MSRKPCAVISSWPKPSARRAALTVFSDMGRRGERKEGKQYFPVPVSSQSCSKSVVTCVDSGTRCGRRLFIRSEEHTSELQSLMRSSSAVYCLKQQRQHYDN